MDFQLGLLSDFVVVLGETVEPSVDTIVDGPDTIVDGPDTIVDGE